jgi:hypothetical protein
MPVAPATITLYGADGAPIEQIQHEALTHEELAILVAYKKFLHARQYREALYCQRCWGHDLEDGCDARLKIDGMTAEMMIKCRCRMAYVKGAIAQ